MICGKNVKESETRRRLLKYVRNNDEEGIERLVVSTGDRDILNTEYSEGHTVLNIACYDEDVTKSTIRKLIKLGANCTQPTGFDNWETIHYAAINADVGKLSTIVDYLTNEEINSLVSCRKHGKHAESFSNNALSILLKYGNRRRDFKECGHLLIQKGINVHQADSNGVTPLDLMKQEPELSGIEAEDTQGKKTFDLVKLDNEDDFLLLHLTEAEANDTDGATVKTSSCTLLQLCCAKGLSSCVKHLLKSEANPNMVIPKYRIPPIMIAVMNDHEEIVKLLLKTHNILLPVDILIQLQSLTKYIELILEHLEKSGKERLRNYLTAKDNLGRTCLHYAVHNRNSGQILKLLSLGAPLTRKNLHRIDPGLLEKFFDSCVSSTKEDKSIEINYEALISGSNEGKVHECDFLRDMTRLKKLLNHPVISSYLEVKWQKFRRVVFAHLFFYLIAYISLLFYGFAYNTLTHVSNLFLLVSLVLIVIRDFIRLLIFRIEYLKRTDSFIDLVSTGGIVYIIVAGWVHTPNNHNLRVAFSIVFLTYTFGIFLQLGNLPFFTIKVIILRQISLNFCKYMIFYVFPFLAFFFCFYMLQESSNDTFFQTLYKVIIMFANDPNSDYPQEFTTNPIFSHIIYICFIVMIGIILQNVLVGLAVNDLREIKKEAEFIDKKEKASYVTNFERVLFSRHRESSHWLFERMFRKLLQKGNVFKDEYVLVIEPYNNGCVYVKGESHVKHHIKDQSIISLLQKIFKDSETPYSLRTIYEKLERIENMLELLSVKK